MNQLRFRSLRAITATAATLALLTVAAGCFKHNAPVKSGTLAQNVSLKGATFTVSSKEFTEQLVLCHITSLALRSAGATVTEKCGMQGSNTTRTALTSGSSDMYWEYTGTAWVNYLKHTEPLNDPAKLYQAVSTEDLTQNHVKWLATAPANDTYAIGVKTATAKELGISTISDYAKLVQTNPSKASMCVASEFAGRDDGLPGLQKAYGFTVPKAGLASLAEGAIFDAVAKGDPCIFGEVTTTDGRLTALGMTVLEDDKQFFPIYNPALTVRESVYNAHPDVAKVIEPIARALTNQVFQQLNGNVDVKGQDPTQVAQAWLQEKGLIGK